MIKIINVLKDGTETEIKPLEMVYDYILARCREWSTGGGAALAIGALALHNGYTLDQQTLEIIVSVLGAAFMALPTTENKS